jgi:hypothetical protein
LEVLNDMKIQTDINVFVYNNIQMKNFIKLTSLILNKSHIIEIIKQPNKYFIHMSNTRLYGEFVMANGSVSTKQNIIEICEQNHNQDYNIITDLLKELN